MTRKSFSGTGFCTICILFAAGCSHGGNLGTITVTRYPSFYNPDLKKIAVLPFGNQSPDPAAAQRIGEKVETALINNRTYDVYTRQHLKEILKEQDLAASGIVDADAAQRIGKLGSVQALVCGVCNQYGSSTRQEIRTMRVPIWGTNAKGYAVITGYQNQQYQWIRHDAVVECNVVVIDTVTGKQVAAVNEPSRGWSEGSPPKYSDGAVLEATEQNQVGRILRALAVVRTQIKLKGTPLRIATGQYDMKWDWQDRIISSDEKLFAVATLPVEAGRNDFKITVVRKDGRDVLAEQAFVWPEGATEHSCVFDVKSILDRNGFGVYQAKLYSGPQPVAWYDFEIAEKR